MATSRKLPRAQTVFDVPRAEIEEYQVLLDHLSDIGMEIAEQFAPQPGPEGDSMLDKLEAFERATSAVLVSMRLSHTLGMLRERPGAVRSMRRARSPDPDDAVLYRPVSEVFGEACIDLATAASIVGIPPWIKTTPDELRSLIVRLARHETARLKAAGQAPLVPFSAQILEYKPRPSPD